MTTPADIIGALRTRATDQGWNVVLYRVVDPETDTLPTVMIASHEEGRQADDEAHGLVHRLLDVSVMLVAEGDDDHTIEALELAEQLANDLVHVQADVPDDLGVGVNTLEVIETRADTRTSSTDYMIIELLIRAAYIGD